MEETAELTAPTLLGANMLAAFRLAPAHSTTSPIEKRLDAGFAAFNTHRPPVLRWTPRMRAERWAGYAIECNELLKNSGVAPIFRDFDVEAVADWLPANYRKMAKKLMTMLDNPQLLAIGGDRGTGKTALACGLIIKFCECGRRAVYRTIAEYFNELSDAAWEAKQAARAKYYGADLLVLDEVQVRDDGRQWQDNELTTLIDRRHRDGKATLLLSNLKSEALKANLGESVWRRMIETGGMPIETNWPRIHEVAEKIERERRERKSK